MTFELNLWTSAGIMIGFSLLIVVLDEFVARPWRDKKWKKRAASGDPEAQELLRIAASAKVYEE
jgi:hypothetical protein